MQSGDIGESKEADWATGPSQHEPFGSIFTEFLLSIVTEFGKGKYGTA